MAIIICLYIFSDGLSVLTSAVVVVILDRLSHDAAVNWGWPSSGADGAAGVDRGLPDGSLDPKSRSTAATAQNINNSSACITMEKENISGGASSMPAALAPSSAAAYHRDTSGLNSCASPGGNGDLHSQPGGNYNMDGQLEEVKTQPAVGKMQPKPYKTGDHMVTFNGVTFWLISG